MTSDLTNLLSSDRIRAFQRKYLVRLATVGIVLIVVLICVQGALLLPSYMYAQQQQRVYQAYLDSLAQVASGTEERTVSERIAALDAGAERIESLLAYPSASALVRSILAVPRPGIVLTRFTLTAPATAGQEGTLAVSGIAANRESLRHYHVALESLAFVSVADLPLGAYAAEAEIPFTITLRGTLLP